MDVTDATLLETTPVAVGRSARVRLTVEQCLGDTLGPLDYAPSTALEVSALVVSSMVWRTAPDCTQPVLVVREVPLRFPNQGRWTVEARDTPLIVDVLPEAEGECVMVPGKPCLRDCNCLPYEQCLSDEQGVQRCATACEFSRDCRGRGACDAGLCDLDSAECENDEHCPDGFDCVDKVCHPVFSLNQFTRHSCTCDADCDRGLRCVTNPEGGHCEALCLTTNDGWCQGAHTCFPQWAIDATMGICGWLGE